MNPNDQAISEISTVFALLLRCPFNVALENECPFARYRQGLSSEEKFRLAETLSDQERKDLLDHHMKCAQTRSVSNLAGKNRKRPTTRPNEFAPSPGMKAQ